MMRKIIDGRPVKHVHSCPQERIGMPMTAKERHEFSVECLAEEYRQTGSSCVVRAKANPSEADLEYHPQGDSVVNIKILCPSDGRESLDDVDVSWMVEAYRHSGAIPRVTFAYIDIEEGMTPVCGREYSLYFHSISLIPDECNEPLPEQLSPVQLAEKYAETWRKLDASIVRPYLDKDFHYSSDWVFDEMPSRYEYLDYFRPKLNTIRRAGSTIDVRIAVNEKTGDVGLIMGQGKKNAILLLTTADGRITSARMADFDPDYKPLSNAFPYQEPHTEGWMEAYEGKLYTGLKAVGWFIQDYFKRQGIEFPAFRWIQSELGYPAFQHLAFSYQGNIYSVLFEFVNQDGNHILKRDISNQIRECHENDMIPCIIPMDYETYEPLLDGNHLISTESREPVTFGNRDGEVLMSKWEVNSFGIMIVRNELKKQGRKILSFCDVPQIEPHIWFEDESGKMCYVIVNTISENTSEAVTYQLNHQMMVTLIKYSGYYAEVGIFPADPFCYDENGQLIPLSKRFSMTDPCGKLYRGKEFKVYFAGLEFVEKKAAESGVRNQEVFYEGK